jgi:ribosomal protein S18 acetylase RimI-like enzyme
MKPLPSSWETERVRVADATDGDLPDLRRVHDETSYISEWTGYKSESADPMAGELRHEHLPPNGKADRHRVQTLREKVSGEAVGFLVYYHGYPEDSVLWLATLAVAPGFQRTGLGAEVVRGFRAEATAAGFDRIGLAVSIKNWPALRFWIACGFDRAVKLVGPELCREDTFATLTLHSILKGS